MSKPNIFEAVKQSVTTRQAASFYGLKVSQNGMCRCPFHNDRKPSMKVDSRFHCFGCGADGGVIDFVSRIYGISKKEAAEKLAEDFAVPYEKWKPPDRKARKEQKQIRKEKNRIVRFEETERNFFRILTDYYHMLLRWKEDRAPRSPDDEWDEYFCEALQNISKIEYVMDCFLEADLEERIDIINEYGEKVKAFERRIEQYRSEEAGRPGKDDGSVR